MKIRKIIWVLTFVMLATFGLPSIVEATWVDGGGDGGSTGITNPHGWRVFTSSGGSSAYDAFLRADPSVNEWRWAVAATGNPNAQPPAGNALLGACRRSDFIWVHMTTNTNRWYALHASAETAQWSTAANNHRNQSLIPGLPATLWSLYMQTRPGAPWGSRSVTIICSESFMPAIRTVSVTVNAGPGASNASGGGTLEVGSRRPISATCASNHTFSHWTASGMSAPTGQNPTITVPDNNVTLTAHCSLNPCQVTVVRYQRDRTTMTQLADTVENARRITNSTLRVSPGASSRSGFDQEFGSRTNTTSFLGINSTWNQIINGHASADSPGLTYPSVEWTTAMREAFARGGVATVTREVQFATFERRHTNHNEVRVRERRVRIYHHNCPVATRPSLSGLNSNVGTLQNANSNAPGSWATSDFTESSRRTFHVPGNTTINAAFFNRTGSGNPVNGLSWGTDNNTAWINNASDVNFDRIIQGPWSSVSLSTVTTQAVDHYQKLNTTCNRQGIINVMNAGTFSNVSLDRNTGSFGSTTLITNRFTNLANAPFGNPNQGNAALRATSTNAFYTQTDGCLATGSGNSWNRGLHCPVGRLASSGNGAAQNVGEADRVANNRGWGAQSGGVTSDDFRFARDNEYRSIRFDVRYPALSNTAQTDITVNPASNATHSRVTLAPGTPAEMRWNFGGGRGVNDTNTVLTGSQNSLSVRAPWASEQGQPHRFSMTWRYHANAISPMVRASHSATTADFTGGTFSTGLDIYCQSRVNVSTPVEGTVRRRNPSPQWPTNQTGVGHWIRVNFNRGVSE